MQFKFDGQKTEFDLLMVYYVYGEEWKKQNKIQNFKIKIYYQ